MPFKISSVAGTPSFDSLPVAKITGYPMEQRDYKPYAQCILCVNEQSLFLRMWAFEVSPAAASELRGVLYIFPQKPEVALSLSVRADESFACALVRGGTEIPALGKNKNDVAVRPFSGEDLQGVYWGASVTVSRSFLREIAGEPALNPGNSFVGNFFKLCDAEPSVHKGCFFPADFAKNILLPQNMGEFTVVAY